MKKIFSILSIVVLMASFASCDPMDSGDDTQKPGIENPDNNGDDTPTPPAEGEGNENEGEGNENEGEGGTDTPVPPTPTETRTITIDATSSFSPALPGSATKTKESYVLTVDGAEYPVTFYNPSKGFFKSGSNIRLCGKVDTGDNTGYPGYMTLPGIDGFSLTAVEITGGNSSGRKTYLIYDKDPIDPEVTDEESLGSVLIAQTEIQTITLSASSAGASYYLTVMGLASDSNAQFSKLVLTYTK